MLKKLALGVALVAAAGLTFAQDKRPGYGTPVTTATAKKIAAGVIAECSKNSWNVAVAIVEPSGALVYFERMENTQYASNDIAIGNSYSLLARLPWHNRVRRFIVKYLR